MKEKKARKEEMKMDTHTQYCLDLANAGYDPGVRNVCEPIFYPVRSQKYLLSE